MNEVPHENDCHATNVTTNVDIDDYLHYLDLSQVFRQIFVESVFLFSKMIFQTHLAFGNQLSYECDFDCTNLQCI